MWSAEQQGTTKKTRFYNRLGYVTTIHSAVVLVSQRRGLAVGFQLSTLRIFAVVSIMQFQRDESNLVALFAGTVTVVQ